MYCFVQSEEAFVVEGSKKVRKLIFMIETARIAVCNEITDLRYKEFNNIRKSK